MKSLTQKTSSGLSWSALEKFINQGLLLAIQILLARLIEPTEFGLVALLSIFIAFSHTIIDGGFSQAIIQKKNVDRPDVSTVFFFNLIISVVLYGIFFFAAPVIANFYSEPRLLLLVRVLALTLIISGAGKIQNCLLIRNLEFRNLFRITTPSLFIGGLVGVIAAFNGYEAWSLVFMQLTTTLFSTICYWMFPHKDLWPRWEFRFTSLRNMGRFGIGMLGANLVSQSVQNVYGLVIGKAFSFDQLAFYNRAGVFHRAPAQGITDVLNRVLFPVFSTIQNDNTRICKALRKGIPVIAFIMLPLMVFLMCAADHIVIVLLTAKWLPAAEYMRWFPIIGMIYPIAAIQLSVIRAKGFSGLFFGMAVLKNSIAIVVLVITIQFGVLAVVIGQVGVSIVLTLLVNSPACHFVVGYRISEQLVDVLPYIACAGLSAIAYVSIAFVATIDSHLIMLVLQGAVFSGTYLAICYFCGLHGLTEVYATLSSLRRRFSNSKS